MGERAVRGRGIQGTVYIIDRYHGKHGGVGGVGGIDCTYYLVFKVTG